MATAHLLHGFLGVGKTTFARHLEQTLPAIRFTHDEWMQRLYGDDPPERHFADYAARVSAQMESVWTRCLSLGLDVVLDAGLWSRAERDRMLDLVRALGAEAKLYRLVCDEATALRRITARNAALGGSLYISEATYRTLRQRFEPLEADEERIEVAGGHSAM